MLPRVNLARGDEADYLLFATNDLISRRLVQGGGWEPHLVQVTRTFTAGIQRPLVLDVGANLGGYCVPVGKALQQAGGTVHAFEAQRIVFYQLCGNVFLNRLDNVFASHVALGDRDATVTMPVPDYSALANVGGFSLNEEFRKLNGTQGAMTAAVEQVNMARLDSIEFPRPVNFIKLDVEGMEIDVLRGAVNCLERNAHPPIYFEAWSEAWFSREKEALLAFVRELGYEAVRLGAYDHLAQHPGHPVQMAVSRESNRVELRRLK